MLHPSRYPKLMGQRFARLVAVERALLNGRAHWCCRCDCGQIAIVDQARLLAGRTKSCGCYRRDHMLSVRTEDGNKKHGRARSKEYSVRQNMLSRCYNPKSTSYQYYGARGVVVCDRWRESFENFLADMGRAPSAKHSIDRKNNDGNYEPGNCRWATALEQNRNQRKHSRLS